MNSPALLWALWLAGGGPVNGGFLEEMRIAAFFEKKEECVRVQTILNEERFKNRSYHRPVRWSQCVQARYVK